MAAIQDHNAIGAYLFPKEHLGGRERSDGADCVIVGEREGVEIGERLVMG